MAGARVLVDVPPIPLDAVRDLLAGAGVTVEGRPPGPRSGGDVVGLLVWGTAVREDDFARLPQLRVVSTCSVGYNRIDVAAATRHGVVVCNVPDYCVDEMAESTLALLLSLLRGVVVLDRSVRAGRWDDRAAGPLRRVSGTRLGLVGFGRIGRAVAARALALGFEVWVADPHRTEAELVAAGVRPASLAELLPSCDAVSLHLPLNEETAGFIGERELALMRPGSLLINTARAGLLDWEAFLHALESGHLAAAAVDTIAVEPPTPQSPVPDLPNLIVTPHAAWYSPESEQEVYRRATLALRTVLEGGLPETGVVTS